MNKSTLEKANKLANTIDVLDDLNFVLCAPYPQFLCHDIDVNSASFDEKTLGELKETIKNFIDKKTKRITGRIKDVINMKIGSIW